MLRALAKQLANQGRRVFEGIIQRGEQGVKANPRNKDVARFGPEQQSAEAQHTRYFVKLDVSSQPGRSTWVQNLTGTSSKSFLNDLRMNSRDIFERNGATQLLQRSHELVTGRKLISLYALVGLYMKAGSRNIDLEDEQYDHICQEIKTMMEPGGKQAEKELTQEDIRLCNLQLGPLIAKGSNSAVYSARLLSDEDDTNDDSSADQTYNDVAIITDQDLDIEEEWKTRSNITVWDTMCETSEYGGAVETKEDSAMDLAVKMMFNYDFESDGDSILRAMENEMVPSKCVGGTETTSIWSSGMHVKKKRLKPHPKVVDIRGVFIDEVPKLPDALSQYPDALPARLNPEGFGHNKTMFLIMKKYDTTLRGYLANHKPTLEESLFLLAQLLEAVVHLSQQEVAHRDLKSDNILVDASNLDLVVSDFGCCLADSGSGMKIPFTSHYTDRGGNVALMAPEIACAKPGFGSYLDYTMSDLWSVGALAYEIFGCENPFYRNVSGRLDSKTYCVEDLPELPDYVPCAIRNLIKCILSRNPLERPSAAIAANLVQLHLWAPDVWLAAEKPPCKLDLTRWLLLETAGVMCYRSWTIETNPFLSLKQCFLARNSIDELLQAFSAITSVN